MSRPYLSEDGAGGWLIAVKAVPGARSDQIAGGLGDRLKIRISAPPEGGKANKAICSLVAERIGCRARDVEIVSGATGPEKVVRVRSADRDAVLRLPE